MNALTLLSRSQRIISGDEILAKKIVLYGDPGTGKTHLAATCAASPNVSRIYWFDCDRSLETLVYSPDITDSMKEKIIPFDLTGSNEYPVSAETLLKGFTSRKPKKLCYAHGRINCGECTAPGQSLQWSLFSLTASDVVVIDPGSKVAELLYVLSSQLNNTNNKQQHWGDFYGYMDDIQNAILACPTNVIWVSHEMDIMRTVNKGTAQEREVLDRKVPMCGSRNYSKKMSKDYGYKILTYLDGKKFKATVSPGEVDKAVVSSRKPVTLYDEEGQPSLVSMFSADPMSAEQIAAQQPKSGISIKPKLKR